MKLKLLLTIFVIVNVLQISNCEILNDHNEPESSPSLDYLELDNNKELTLNGDVIDDDDNDQSETVYSFRNDPPKPTELQQQTELHQNYTNFIRISELLNVFSIKQIGEMWSQIGDKLTANCSMDMIKYFKALEAGTTWAIKMDDATGHYTNGYYYGNNYFTGSMSLCRKIFKTERDIMFEEKKLASQNTGLSVTKAERIKITQTLIHENPTFMPGFYVMKIALNESQTSTMGRVIYIGACLPSSCSIDDVNNMAVLSMKQNQGRSIDVLDIRSPTIKHFSLWEDSTFRILVGVSAFVGFLMFWGTIYDLIIMKRLRRKMKLKKISKDLATDSSSGLGCTTYDLTNTKDNKSDLTVGIAMPSSVNNNNSDENLAIDTISQDEPQKLSVCSELLLSFSVITNFNAICDRSVGSDTIPSIHGLRAFSMAWVILGHACIVVFKYSDNMDMRKNIEKEFLFQTILNGAYSVDTFFFISGFLVSYIYFRTNAKGKLEKLSKGVNEITAGVFHFFGLVFYRFVRLTTPYIFVLGVVEVSMKYFNQNSVFEPPTLDHETCPKFWWRNILYINTFFPVEEMCMLWSWYLADDTQFYIIGAIILIIGVRHFKVAASTLVVFMLSSWAITAYVAFSNNHMPNTDDPLALFDKIYDKPWTRLGGYLVGMTVGWILFKTNCKIKMSKFVVVIGWTLSTLCSLYLMYGLFNVELTRVGAAAYSSLSHTAWAVSLAWIIIACSTGYGGWVNKLLSASCLYPFSRVTYCAYLVHPIVIRVLALNSDAPLHLGVDSMVVIFFGQVVLSYVLSFIVSMSFEAPVVTMLKILSPSRKKRV